VTVGVRSGIWDCIGRIVGSETVVDSHIVRLQKSRLMELPLANQEETNANQLEIKAITER
jgi:hypothetical protein